MRAFFNLTGLLVVAICLVMGFRSPKPEEISRAIGNTEGLPINLQRAFDPVADFAPMPVPKRGEWLAEHPEAGQTFADFVSANPNKIDSLRNKIYLQPFDQFREGRSYQLETLKTYAAAYFEMDVEILPSLSTSGSKITTRINPISGNWQVLTGDAMMILKNALHADAYCLLGITMEDLYPDASWNFVFGQASLRDRIGLFSFARYDPSFYGEERGKNYQEVLLRRTCKVLVHEVAHMFSMEHCIFFKCVLNGSNHLQESDARPLSLCPVCLRKLQFVVGFDVVERYQKLLHFYEKVNFASERRWVLNRLKWILDDGKGN